MADRAQSTHSFTIGGQARDYDDWARHTDSSWSYALVQKSFDAFEEFTSPIATTTSSAAADSENGTPKLSVYDASADYHPLKHAFAAAFSELSLNSVTPPLEGEGLGPYRITTRAGRRCSFGNRIFDTGNRTENLHLLTDARVTKVCFEDRRATGVLLFLSWRGVNASSPPGGYPIQWSGKFTAIARGLGHWFGQITSDARHTADPGSAQRRRTSSGSPRHQLLLQSEPAHIE